MGVRAAREEDLEGILRIEVESFPSPWPRRVLRAHLGDIFLVHEGEEGIEGYIIAGVELSPDLVPWLHILSLAVAKGRRRQGIGTTLLKTLLGEAEAAGIKRAFLEVRVGNHAAIRFYERNGFRKVGRIPGFYRNGEDAFLMVHDAGG